MKTLPVAALFCVLPLVMTAQTLWKETKYGMTFEEVRRLFPHAKDKSFKAGGQEVLVLQASTEIADHPFEVSFTFGASKRRLSRVTLRATEKLLNDHGATVARHFVMLLQSQYGEGKVSEDQYSSDPRDIDRVWTTPDKTLVRVSFFKDEKLGHGAYRLSIDYDGESLRGASDL